MANLVTTGEPTIGPMTRGLDRDPQDVLRLSWDVSNPTEIADLGVSLSIVTQSGREIFFGTPTPAPPGQTVTPTGAQGIISFQNLFARGSNSLTLRAWENRAGEFVEVINEHPFTLMVT